MPPRKRKASGGDMGAKPTKPSKTRRKQGDSSVEASVDAGLNGSSLSRKLSSVENLQKAGNSTPPGKFSASRCRAMFESYMDPSDGKVGPEGIEKLCADIAVEPENVGMLVLAYHMGAKAMGYFTQDEWMTGMHKIGCDSVAKLKAAAPTLATAADSLAFFKEVYTFSFAWAKDAEQRSMDVETAKAMLALLLGPRWPLCTKFIDFLAQGKYKVVNKDQWQSLLEFATTVSPDCSTYDDTAAWPTMLDEFVEHVRAGN
eukprot:Colp12_sorted_trinity150504_noHs@28510